jgi:Enoyl-(Acyl carrier protein) reductase
VEIRELQAFAVVAGRNGAGPDILKVGIPLELPAGVLTGLSTTFPLTRVEVNHASSAAQLAELEVGQLDVALVREYPADPRYDAVLAVEETLGVILATAQADKLAAVGTGRAFALVLDQLASAAPSGRPGLPEEIAAAIAYLADDAASFVQGAILATGTVHWRIRARRSRHDNRREATER